MFEDSYENIENKSYKCDCCGSCCRNLDKSEIYADLNRGDGICIYLVGNLCSIYEKRPLLCRIDEAYDNYFRYIMDRDEYYKLNIAECRKLKK